MFDPRLTEEYQVAGEPWTKQTAAGEIAAMEIGAALWGVASQNYGYTTVTKTLHIGCSYGYMGLKWHPRSPVFNDAGASGLTVADFQDVILVNEEGQRFCNEVDESDESFNAGLNGTAAGVTAGQSIFEERSFRVFTVPGSRREVSDIMGSRVSSSLVVSLVVRPLSWGAE